MFCTNVCKNFCRKDKSIICIVHSQNLTVIINTLYYQQTIFKTKNVKGPTLKKMVPILFSSKVERFEFCFLCQLWSSQWSMALRTEVSVFITDSKAGRLHHRSNFRSCNMVINLIPFAANNAHFETETAKKVLEELNSLFS